MQNFTCTSLEPYNRHIYKLHFYNQKTKTFEHWEDVQEFWFNYSHQDNFLKYITVEDKRGFKN